MNTTGRKIFLARKELNLTQKQLAEKIGQPASVVARWETGRYNPSAKNLEDLSKALGKDYKYFYEDMRDNISNLFSAGAWPVNHVVKEGPRKFTLPETQVLAIVKKGEVIFVEAGVIPSAGSMGVYNINIRDNSLSPEFAEGDTLEVRPGSEIEDDKFHIIELKNEHFIYKCRANGKKLILTLNKSKREVYCAEIKILGKIISVKKSI